ncbi:hypothetical protein AGMMS49990_09570 [Endomicrobiia bacterium]|nr:hypothetical protein AGMMS49990_09570 [Endomicrobiia bacterium]
MISFDFTAMQKAEAEQKERAKIWADHLAGYPSLANYYARYPIEAQKEADRYYKSEQEIKQSDEERAKRWEEIEKNDEKMREM